MSARPSQQSPSDPKLLQMFQLFLKFRQRGPRGGVGFNLLRLRTFRGMNVFICGFVPSLHTMIVITTSILILAVITYKFFMKRDVEGQGEGCEEGRRRPGRGQ